MLDFLLSAQGERQMLFKSYKFHFQIITSQIARNFNLNDIAGFRMIRAFFLKAQSLSFLLFFKWFFITSLAIAMRLNPLLYLKINFQPELLYFVSVLLCSQTRIDNIAQFICVVECDPLWVKQEK